jgi:hypothetical protein
MGGLGLTPKSAFAARRDGDWERLMLALNACETAEQVDAFAAEVWPTALAMPRGWPPLIAEEIEKRRDLIARR